MIIPVPHVFLILFVICEFAIIDTVCYEGVHSQPVHVENAKNDARQSGVPRLDRECHSQSNVKKIKLNVGQFICNGNFMLGMDIEAGLSLIQISNTDEHMNWWAHNTAPKNGGAFLKMENNGNLLVYSKNDKVLWSSNTTDNPGAELSLGEGGVAAIKSKSGALLWAVQYRGCDWGNRRNLVHTMQIQKMYLGQSICARDSAAVIFGLNDEGVLGLWDGYQNIWKSDSDGKGVFLNMQVDGNLVVRDKDHNAIWSSTSSGNKSAVLDIHKMSDGGYVVRIQSLAGLTVFSSVQSLQPVELGEVSSRVSKETSAFKATNSPSRHALYSCQNHIDSKDSLYCGEFIYSPNERFRFGLAMDCDLSLWDRNTKLWSGSTICHDSGAFARVQEDGNFVVYSDSNEVLWASNTDASENIGSVLSLNNEGIAKLTNTLGKDIWISGPSNEGMVDASTLDRKILAGYQGWFTTECEGGQWSHWSRGGTPSNNTITVDMWPDTREYDDDELCLTELEYENGSKAGLFSSYNTKTVERHCGWMHEYGIDGVFVQRFIRDALSSRHFRDSVLQNIRRGTEKYGRVFANMYDISGSNTDTCIQDMIADWKHLVDDLKITESKRYLRHRGRPVLSIWGFGFTENPGFDPSEVSNLLDWFSNTAEEKYRVTLVGGVPTYWRELFRDSYAGEAWASVYRSFHVLSPWTVTRVSTIDAVDRFRVDNIERDLAECRSLGIDYLPVAFPGFSWGSLKGSGFNKIPRQGGNFFWRQFYNLLDTGNNMVYVAMFDELDEGTAIFKVTADVDQTPTEGRFLTLNEGQDNSNSEVRNIPSDWYLQLAGYVGTSLRENTLLSITMPSPKTAQG